MVEKLKREDQILTGVVTVVLFLGCFAAALMFWKGTLRVLFHRHLQSFFTHLLYCAYYSQH